MDSAQRDRSMRKALAPSRKEARATRNGKYRSGFECKFASSLEANGLTAEYETDRIKYTQPSCERTYTPDWKIKPGVYIETKGRFTGADRKKMLWLRESNPDITVYMLFMRSDVTLSKSSKTTYGDWCDKQKPPIQWADIRDHRKWKGWFKE